VTQFTADTSTTGGNKHRKFQKSILEKGKVKQSHYRPEVPTGFQEVKVPR